MLKRICHALVLSICWSLSSGVNAELTIQITQGVEDAIPIAIVPFGGAAQGADNLGGIVAADLARSGRFKTMPEGDMLTQPTAPQEVQPKHWQVQGQDYLAVGQVRATAEGQFEAEFWLYDVFKGTVMATYRLPFSSAESRRTAHRISDIIYKALTGEPGAFATRVSYVTVTKLGPRQRQYKLQIADADGVNPQTVVTSSEPVMSPAWSPDGKRMAYVSFEGKAAAIFVQTLATGQRQKVSEAPGINGAPAWSPDGAQLAVTLSKDGNPEIYTVSAAGGALRRLTDSLSIDTEPSWSPDGSRVLFTSDRGGKPQLYTTPANGGNAERLTYDGDYNARGVYSPDGRSVAMVHGNGGDYRIAVMDLATKQVRVLTKGHLDESPSFAPNGSMIMYASNQGGAKYLSAVSLDGKVHQRLVSDAAEVRQPAWSPL